MFSVKLETMDLSEIQSYLDAHGITAIPTGKVYAQPGGGEDVVYRATTREALESMYRYFFNSGDPETTTEDLATIIEVFPVTQYGKTTYVTVPA
jgi:hypothetical protein